MVISTIQVSVSALVRPTERQEKVESAIERMFPGLTMDKGADRIEAFGGLKSLQTFHKLLREQRILDTARSVMLDGRVGEAVQLRLSKQAAFIGRVNFPPEEEPLGSIHVQITGDERIIDWLAPRTEDGAPIKEIELSEEDV